MSLNSFSLICRCADAILNVLCNILFKNKNKYHCRIFKHQFFPKCSGANQLDTAIVKVDNQTCSNISAVNNKADITCSKSQRGQRIQIYKESGLLMFCEVQVWGKYFIKQL